MKFLRPALTLALAFAGLLTAHAQVPTWPKTTPADVTAAGLGVQVNGADFGNNTFVLSATLGGTTATPAVFTSPDGTTWTRRTLPVTGANVGRPRFLNGKFYLGMDAATNNLGVPTGVNGAVLSSADGITWSAVTLGTQFFGPDAFTYGSGIYLASASPISNQTTQIITSTDGLNWTPRTVAAGTITSGIAFFKSKFYVTVTGGAGAGLYVSTDGTTWAKVATAPANPGELTASPTALLVNLYNIGNSSQALSTDGVTFASASPGIPFASGSIRYVNGAFVTPASLGLISGQIISNQVSASFDGRTWSTLATRSSSSTETQDVREIVYGNGNYVFVGEFDVFTGTTTISPGGTSTGGGTTAPTISTQPAATQNIILGGSVSFTITATGTGLGYQWYFNTVAISGATNATYTINATTSLNAGSYTVVITNAGGSITSNAATLTINAAPVITTQPASQTIPTGSSVTFTGAANGTGLTYQWKFNTVAISGATNATYTINATTSLNAGNYTVVITNAGGSVTSNIATLTVNAGPIFTTQPLSLPAFVGATVNFTAVANSATAITYQWQKGGINISGATSSTLSLANIQLTDAGSYALIATSTGGATTSRFARLVVLVPQANAIVYASTVSSLSGTAGGTINLAYFMTNVGTRTWGANHYLSIRDINNTFVAFASLIGTLPGETTTANLNFPAPTTPGTYTYYVQALENGIEFFSTQTAVTLTVLAPLTNSITYNTTTFPVSAAPGANIVFTYNVTNTGTQTWGANHLLSLKNNLGTTLSSALLTILTPNASKTVNLSFTAPTAPGTYNYTVQASQTGVGNFNTQANLTLTVLAPRPNAITYTETRLPDEVAPAALLNLNYSLSNAGTQTWGPGHFASLRDANGTFLAFIPLNGIAPGGKTTVAFSFTAPTTPGLYTYYVQALEDGIEFFSTQDVVVVTVDALPLRNAVAYNATTFPATAAPGATVNFTYNLTNRGTKTWGATDFLSFRDVDNTFLGFVPLSGVAAGASKTLILSFTAPTTPGIYTYKAQAMEDGVAFYPMDDTVVLFVQ